MDIESVSYKNTKIILVILLQCNLVVEKEKNVSSWLRLLSHTNTNSYDDRKDKDKVLYLHFLVLVFVL